jgi:hypothetical protein
MIYHNTFLNKIFLDGSHFYGMEFLAPNIHTYTYYPHYIKQGVCHTVALPFMFKSILRQKKNNENSIISPCKNIIFKKSSKTNQNPWRYYNSITNLKFQTQAKISSFQNPHIKNRPIIIIT